MFLVSQFIGFAAFTLPTIPLRYFVLQIHLFPMLLPSWRSFMSFFILYKEPSVLQGDRVAVLLQSSILHWFAHLLHSTWISLAHSFPSSVTLISLCSIRWVFFPLCRKNLQWWAIFDLTAEALKTFFSPTGGIKLTLIPQYLFTVSGFQNYELSQPNKKVLIFTETTVTATTVILILMNSVDCRK